MGYKIKRGKSVVKEMIQYFNRINPIKSSDKTMVVLQLDDEQVIELVSQLSNFVNDLVHEDRVCA